MYKWLFHQNGFTRTSLSATVTRKCVCVVCFYIVKAPHPVSVTQCPTQHVEYANRNALSMFKALNKGCK